MVFSLYFYTVRAEKITKFHRKKKTNNNNRTHRHENCSSRIYVIHGNNDKRCFIDRFSEQSRRFVLYSLFFPFFFFLYKIVRNSTKIRKNDGIFLVFVRYNIFDSVKIRDISRRKKQGHVILTLIL